MRFYCFPIQEVHDMMSEHIDNRKLYKVVTEDAVLEEAEMQHLKTCEECMELVRVFVRHQISQNANG